MLVLTRNIGQSIIAGDREITFTILNVQGNKVRVGVAAHPNISVHREEIYERIQRRSGEQRVAYA